MKNKNVWLILMVLIANMFFVGTASAACSPPGGDYFGYIWIDNRGCATPPSTPPTGPGGWIEISGSGTEILPNIDDSYTQNGITLPFTFKYYGNEYTKVNITNNGLILGGPGVYNYVNEPIGTSNIHNFIAPFWDDIVTWNRNPSGGSAGKIYYQSNVLDPATGKLVFVVEWVDNQHYTYSENGVTFEAILYPMTPGRGSNLTFRYKDVTFGAVSDAVGSERCNGNNLCNPSPGRLYPYDDGGSATVGIEGPKGLGLPFSYNQYELATDRAIRFEYPETPKEYIILSKNAPPNIAATTDPSNPSKMTYLISYSNISKPNTLSHSYSLTDVLPSEVEYDSSSSNPALPLPAVYSNTPSPGKTTLTWNLGSLSGGNKGTITLNVKIKGTVGSNILNTVKIDDDDPTVGEVTSTQISTVINQLSLPPNVNVEGIIGTTGGTPSVYWGTDTTFTYYNECATSVGINIHMDDDPAKPDITGSMDRISSTPTDPDYNKWKYTVNFYNSGQRHGATTVTYTPQPAACSTPQSFKIYVDPAGYVYDAITGARIEGATVWLQWPFEEGWDIVPEDMGIMDPNVNHQTTSKSGDYNWLTVPGTYRVYAEAYGYYPNHSPSVNVPPPNYTLHVGLTRIDPTTPIITPTITGTAGNNGWYTGDVSVSWSVSDPESGITSSTGCDATTLSAETAGTTLTCTAVNGWDFSNSGSVTIKIDKSPPVIEITAPATGASYSLNQPVAADYSCSDAISGIATCIGPVANGTNIDTGTVGSKSFSVTSTDNAGYTASATNTYNVNYNFNGFLQPIDNLPMLNALKAGSAVPVKFSLNGDQGLDIFEAGYPVSQKIACDSNALLDIIEETDTAGSSGLSYDAATDQYNYVWKTDKAWAGSCRQLVVMLKDGTDHQANFKFLK